MTEDEATKIIRRWDEMGIGYSPHDILKAGDDLSDVVAALRAENEALKLAICGGEDATSSEIANDAR